MPEDRRFPLVEIWIVEGGRRQRVFRGRNPEHIAWKLKYHARAAGLEQLEIEPGVVPGAPGE